MLLAKYYSLDEMKGDDMALRGRSDIHTEFLWRNLKERDYLEALGVDGMAWT
jgi:hypothetical protein